MPVDSRLYSEKVCSNDPPSMVERAALGSTA